MRQFRMALSMVPATAGNAVLLVLCLTNPHVVAGHWWVFGVFAASFMGTAYFFHEMGRMAAERDTIDRCIRKLGGRYGAAATKDLQSLKGR